MARSETAQRAVPAPASRARCAAAPPASRLSHQAARGPALSQTQPSPSGLVVCLLQRLCSICAPLALAWARAASTASWAARGRAGLTERAIQKSPLKSPHRTHGFLRLSGVPCAHAETIYLRHGRKPRTTVRRGWLAQELGIAVPRLGYEDQALHPRRTPVLLL